MRRSIRVPLKWFLNWADNYPGRHFLNVFLVIINHRVVSIVDLITGYDFQRVGYWLIRDVSMIEIYEWVMIYDSAYLIQALKKRVIKIGRKNKTEDGQVETESQPDDKDDKKNLIFPTKTKKGIFARLRKWLFLLRSE